uniref:Uncharacterized protein n=1 Tax=Ditylenchus dipsaci TaxID=166011 RepID=A0A915D5Q4_9BILA
MTHNWADFRTCDPFPPAKAIRAFGRSLTTFPGENLDQYVALWYQSVVMSIETTLVPSRCSYGQWQGNAWQDGRFTGNCSINVASPPP